MAPTAKKRSIRSRATAKSTRDAISHPNSTHLPTKPSPISASTSAADTLTDTAALRPNKKRKAQLRHQSILNKVQSGGISKRGESGGTQRKRRPGKKIAAVEGLAGLGDALPELDEEAEDDEWEGLSEAGTDEDVGEDGLPAGMRKARRRRGGVGSGEGGKVVMKSLRHRPGALKRKRLLELRETERMRGNLVQMARSTGREGGAGGGNGGASQAERWKALRAFIGGNMETSGELAGKQ